MRTLESLERDLRRAGHDLPYPSTPLIAAQVRARLRIALPGFSSRQLGDGQPLPFLCFWLSCCSYRRRGQQF